MSLHLYNTLTNKKELFKPIQEDYVRIYSCGQTIYDDVHVGNARTYSAWDILNRYLKWKGYDVFHIMNITDVGHLTDDADQGEDKVEKAAKKEKLEPMELVTRQILLFYKEIEKLNIDFADIYPRATGHMVEMIEAVKKILKHGYAYEKNGTIYFNVMKFEKDYGYPVLGGRKLEDLLAGEGGRVSEDELKEKNSHYDFALWIKADKGHMMKWPSPWGEGYPGWHLECSVMSTKYLGKVFDIHTGGIDHIFPHHPNERAQNITMNKTDEEPIKYWLHSDFITVNGEKMSKSKGNFYTIRELLEEYEPEAIRTLFASTHYRSQSDFSISSLEEAEKKLERLRNTIRKAKESKGGDKDNLLRAIENVKNEFEDAMDDDLNTPLALSKLIQFTGKINNNLDSKPNILDEAVITLEELAGILGIDLSEKREKSQDAAPYIDFILEIREKLRKEKLYSIADEIRDELQKKGLAIEDTEEGARWYIKGKT